MSKRYFSVPAEREQAMFQKARTLQELNQMRLKKEAKIVRNKKKRSAREIGERRNVVSRSFSARAKDIITASIPLP